VTSGIILWITTQFPVDNPSVTVDKIPLLVEAAFQREEALRIKSIALRKSKLVNALLPHNK